MADGVLRKYGWKRDLPDFRDYKMAYIPPGDREELPPSTDLRIYVDEVYDQGKFSSCTGQAIASTMRIVQKKEGKETIRPSRLWIYWNERYMEDSVFSDDGAMIRSGFQVVAKYGAAPEQQWEYIRDNLFTRPPGSTFKNAVQNMVHVYFGIDQDLYDLKRCLAQGFPFVFGFSLYKSFETPEVARTGKMVFPSKGDRLVGGHAVTAVGYDDATSTFTILNSWGTGWGDRGYFHMPYGYLINPGLASDFWTIRTLESQNDPNRAWVEP